MSVSAPLLLRYCKASTPWSRRFSICVSGMRRVSTSSYLNQMEYVMETASTVPGTQWLFSRYKFLFFK